MSEEIKETEETTEVVETKKGGLTEAKLEIIIAILLAITALLTSWAAWIGSLHGGNQATNYAKSNNLSAEGNSSWNEAAQLQMQDMLLWSEISDLQLDIMYAQTNDDVEAEELAAYKLYYKCFENLSESMAEAIGFDFEAADNADPVEYIESWIETERAVTTPFSDQEFIDAYYYEASETIGESYALLEEGQSDNKHGDCFNLVTVIYSVVLFLLGIAGTFKKIPNRTIIVIVAFVAFLIATIYMFTIPMPTGFNLLNFFKH